MTRTRRRRLPSSLQNPFGKPGLTGYKGICARISPLKRNAIQVEQKEGQENVD